MQLLQFNAADSAPLHGCCCWRACCLPLTSLMSRRWLLAAREHAFGLLAAAAHSLPMA